jgi:hypothetical protein
MAHDLAVVDNERKLNEALIQGSKNLPDLPHISSGGCSLRGALKERRSFTHLLSLAA